MVYSDRPVRIRGFGGVRALPRAANSFKVWFFVKAAAEPPRLQKILELKFVHDPPNSLNQGAIAIHPVSRENRVLVIPAFTELRDSRENKVPIF